MFVKLYSYHIDPSMEQELLDIHQKAASFYNKHIDSHSILLKNTIDETKWIEISFYKDKAAYEKGMELVNKEVEIQKLFEAFQQLLVSEVQELKEEEYTMMFPFPPFDNYI